MHGPPQKPKTFYKKANKNGSKKKGKGPVKPTETPKPSELQKHIEALEEYKQGVPIPATLQDFLNKEVVEAMMGLEKGKEVSDNKEDAQVDRNQALKSQAKRFGSCQAHYFSNSEKGNIGCFDKTSVFKISEDVTMDMRGEWNGLFYCSKAYSFTRTKPA